MNSFARSLAVAASVLLAGTSALAATVYDNGAPNGIDGRDITQQITADDFRLGSNYNLSGATVSILSLGNPFAVGSNIEYGIYSDFSGVNFNATPIVNVSFNFSSPFAASAGVKYWLGIDTPGRSNTFFATTAANATSDGQYLYPINGAGPWRGDRFKLQFAFTLQSIVAGGVPEPATWALMIGGFGLVGVGLRRRKAAVA